jgi:hypothetical protein
MRPRCNNAREVGRVDGSPLSLLFLVTVGAADWSAQQKACLTGPCRSYRVSRVKSVGALGTRSL